MDQSGITSQILDLLVGNNKSTNSLGQVDKKRGVADVILRDLSLVVAEFSQVLSRVRSKDRQTNYGIPNHNSAILHQHGVIYSHQESLFQHITHMRIQSLKTSINVAFFPLMALVEGYLL